MRLQICLFHWTLRPSRAGLKFYTGLSLQSLVYSSIPQFLKRMNESVTETLIFESSAYPSSSQNDSTTKNKEMWLSRQRVGGIKTGFFVWERTMDMKQASQVWQDACFMSRLTLCACRNWAGGYRPGLVGLTYADGNQAACEWVQPTQSSTMQVLPIPAVGSCWLNTGNHVCTRLGPVCAQQCVCTYVYVGGVEGD